MSVSQVEGQKYLCDLLSEARAYLRLEEIEAFDADDHSIPQSQQQQQQQQQQQVDSRDSISHTDPAISGDGIDEQHYSMSEDLAPPQGQQQLFRNSKASFRSIKKHYDTVNQSIKAWTPRLSFLQWVYKPSSSPQLQTPSSTHPQTPSRNATLSRSQHKSSLSSSSSVASHALSTASPAPLTATIQINDPSSSSSEPWKDAAARIIMFVVEFFLVGVFSTSLKKARESQAAMVEAETVLAPNLESREKSVKERESGLMGDRVVNPEAVAREIGKNQAVIRIVSKIDDLRCKMWTEYAYAVRSLLTTGFVFGLGKYLSSSRVLHLAKIMGAATALFTSYVVWNRWDTRECIRKEYEDLKAKIESPAQNTD